MDSLSPALLGQEQGGTQGSGLEGAVAAGFQNRQAGAAVKCRSCNQAPGHLDKYVPEDLGVVVKWTKYGRNKVAHLHYFLESRFRSMIGVSL